ncbi:MAG: hypothetical protein P9X24_15900 [Candidatus Hatepunaea meridiana]|nr:hypothetical protein [Candidatus Hatepunaea meridiana]
MLENMRNILFWAKDILQGSLVRNQLLEITNLLHDPQKTVEMSELRCQNLLQEACRNVPYYKEFSDDVIRLEDFPILQKSQIRANYNAFFSTRFKRGSLIPVTTSGSYGTPFTFWLTKQRKARQVAEVIYFGKWAGYSVGQKHAYVRVIHKSGLKKFIQNEILMSPIIMDDAWLQEQRILLKKKRVKIIIGYPTAIGSLAAFCYKNGDNASCFNVTGIITTSEPILPNTREIIKNTFNCSILSRYSSEELGVIAQECPICGNYHLNIASLIVEMLDLNYDKPAQIGQLGRIVVTDLFSHAMPLIRYDTGDIAIKASSKSCTFNTPVMDSVQGRSIEMIYSVNGNPISPFSINGAMRDIDNIIQFQFIQVKASVYTIRLNVLPDFNYESIILQRMHNILGNTATVNIEYVSDIPPLLSGKRPYIINELKIGKNS